MGEVGGGRLLEFLWLLASFEILHLGPYPGALGLLEFLEIPVMGHRGLLLGLEVQYFLATLVLTPCPTPSHSLINWKFEI